MRWLESIAAVYTAEVFQLRDMGQASRVPIFVFGMPRSGTSLVEQILASHPAVFGGGELPDLRRVFLDTRAALPKDDRHPLDPAALSAHFRAMGEAYLTRVRRVGGAAEHVVDKLPANFVYAGLIALLFPQARMIHTRRDPLDTALSLYTTIFDGPQDFCYDLRELGVFYRGYEKLMEHWRTVLPPDRFLEIEYEAIVDDLEGSTRKLLAFCGLPWDDACLRFYETERTVRTASSGQVRQKIYRSSVGRAERYRPYLEPFIAARAGTPL